MRRGRHKTLVTFFTNKSDDKNTPRRKRNGGKNAGKKWKRRNFKK